jgi:hypothetical protein
MVASWEKRGKFRHFFGLFNKIRQAIPSIIAIFQINSSVGAPALYGNDRVFIGQPFRRM